MKNKTPTILLILFLGSFSAVYTQNEPKPLFDPDWAKKTILFDGYVSQHMRVKADYQYKTVTITFRGNSSVDLYWLRNIETLEEAKVQFTAEMINLKEQQIKKDKKATWIWAEMEAREGHSHG